MNAFYDNIFTEGKANYSKATQLGITFASGYIAGVLCAIVSQPADTLVSKLNKDPSATIGSVIKSVGGFGGLYAGLGMRIFMVGTLTGLQWCVGRRQGKRERRRRASSAGGLLTPSLLRPVSPPSSLPRRYIYDAFKTSVGLQASGGSSTPAPKKTA